MTGFEIGVLVELAIITLAALSVAALHIDTVTMYSPYPTKEEKAVRKIAEEAIQKIRRETK